MIEPKITRVFKGVAFNKKGELRVKKKKRTRKRGKSKKELKIITPRPPRKLKCGCVKYYKNGKWFVKWPCQEHSLKGQHE